MRTKHFRTDEFECKCGCGLNKISPAILIICEMVREHFNKPVMVNCGCRCETHNEEVGGVPDSQHKLKGDDFCHAADIRIIGVEPREIRNLLDATFPSCLGIGLYKTFVHIDDRCDRAHRW